MIEIKKESLAPRLFERLRVEHRMNACSHAVEVAFCVYLCGGADENVDLEEIAGQAWLTYPQLFVTWVNGENIPDLSLIHMTLNLATAGIDDFVIGDWNQGWRLTARGLRISKDIERRRRKSN